MNYKMTPAQVKSAIREKLSHIYGVSAKNASDDEFYKASALVVRDLLVRGRDEFVHEAEKQETKQIYYLCMEFLLGRSLKNNLFNLGLEDSFRKALSEMGVKLDNLYEQEPDAGLGNGGLGRLAACFLDGLATQGYPAMGYSLRYEYGIFRQKLVEGWQTELPDFWLPGGEVWMQKVDESAIEVHFDGYIEEQWHDHYHSVRHKNYNPVMAIPYDLYVSGMDGKGISVLRIWRAEANEFDMKLFNSGNYMRAMEQKAMAETITKVLYPEDNHYEGKSLRLAQQYFLVSASVQDIVRRHLYTHSSLDDLPKLAAIHLNDTHPVLAIPELMRIMLDECGYEWDAAWDIVTRTIAYTNHTVMSEALECWSADLFKSRLPRIYQIVEEINRRFWIEMRAKGVDEGKIWRMAPLNDGYVRMANLAVYATHSTNGVSALHSENDIVLFENFELCHKSLLPMVAALCETGVLKLASRYALQKGMLIDVGTALVPDAVSEISVNGKYLVFLTSQKDSAFTDAFGAAFLSSVTDFCRTAEFTRESLLRIGEAALGALNDRTKAKLNYAFTFGEDASAFFGG